MARKQNRLGVRSDQVDIYGRPISADFFKELISELPEWTELDVYKDGTEQLLPVNDDEPDTSPILCDIKYPYNMYKRDQYFTYRESPTVATGKARIKSIKGNTLVWNQLVQNGNFASTSGWSLNNITGGSVSSNVLSFQITTNDTFIGRTVDLKKNHTYFWTLDFKTTLPSSFFNGIKLQNYRNGNWAVANRPTTNDWKAYTTVFTFTEDDASVPASLFRCLSYTDGDVSTTNTCQMRNVMLFDLTAMFGSGNEPTIEEFKSLFPLNYYAYGQYLLNFNGEGLKATGKNLITTAYQSTQNLRNVTVGEQTNESITVTSTGTGSYAGIGLFFTLQSGTYTLKYQAEASDSFSPTMSIYKDSTNIKSINVNTVGTFTLTEPTYLEFRFFATTTSAVRTVKFYDVMLEHGSSASDYEPYTSSTLSLPISTYFPTGMKSAGSVYDELTPTKAITRIGAVDLGSLTYTIDSGNNMYASVTGLKSVSGSEQPNLLCSLFTAIKYEDRGSVTYPNISITSDTKIRIGNSGYTDKDVFKSAMDGVYLFYELDTPVVEATMSFE